MTVRRARVGSGVAASQCWDGVWRTGNNGGRSNTQARPSGTCKGGQWGGNDGFCAMGGRSERGGWLLVAGLPHAEGMHRSPAGVIGPGQAIETPRLRGSCERRGGQ
ncbi:hypothetical protein BO71DRAFT_82324 [Aspergillus ellipticus CBS 707.79]|uniref:Uncharacterized protein n=1 Tax=Aspergillus ellipticus CBS 707.79 TaxID=1448320 RepID=A0A319CYA2_9EURO|nr:hypothetical protein BO71DRAFT_82324 [Aspergillus ellipticus CBS 707.79]